MVRALLINPPAPEPLGTPLLGQQYLAAALLAEGVQVRVIDAAARDFPHDEDWIVAAVGEFSPDIVGIGLYTRWVLWAYRLAERLRGGRYLLVAGGPHATACPEEPFAFGVQAVVVGEAERALVRLARWCQGQDSLERIPGLRFRAPDGSIRSGPEREFVVDLDDLPSPLLAQGLYDPRWYGAAAGRAVIPGGILTSRGCPARCTFCANQVTGRRFRYRSASRVVAELNRYHELSGQTFFSFWDDALTANVDHVEALCAALRQGIGFPLQWGAITRVDRVSPGVLRSLRGAGLVSINVGVESGDDAVLRAIGKGLTTARVVQALEWAKAEGLITVCNFMLGFPQETPVELERTLVFMQRIAPLVDAFSPLGVLVPLPGTPLYERYHQDYGFTRWWLREESTRFAPPPSRDDIDGLNRYSVDDPVLEFDFFRYSAATRALIRECLRFKGEHNLRRMGLASREGRGGAVAEDAGVPRAGRG